jgi:hypothetical protein
VYLFNGRNDLAAIALGALEENVRNGQPTRFDLRTPLGLICLIDLVARFASEITPEVGPPFVTHLVYPDNHLDEIVNTSLHPISLQTIIPILPKLVRPTPPQTPPPPAPRMPTGKGPTEPPPASAPNLGGTLIYPPTGIGPTEPPPASALNFG